MSIDKIHFKFKDKKKMKFMSMCVRIWEIYYLQIKIVIIVWGKESVIVYQYVCVYERQINSRENYNGKNIHTYTHTLS